MGKEDMITFLKRLTRYIGKQIIGTATQWPSTWVLAVVRLFNAIQFKPRELRSILLEIRAKTPCNLLVFGLGNDSVFWQGVSKKGKVAFLEDNPQWLDKILMRLPGLEAYLVDYGTRREQWKELLESPEKLAMTLPAKIEGDQWDIIIVDAPHGFNDSAPGRMKSIFAASRLAKNGCDVFVHDCQREVEKAYCDRYLQPHQLIAEVHKLRHYKITKPLNNDKPV